MNKSELVAAIAQKAVLTRADSTKALNAFVEVVKEELAKGGKVSLVGFGTFSVKDTPAREGRNPRTGAKIKIAAKRTPKFKAGKGLV